MNNFQNTEEADELFKTLLDHFNNASKDAVKIINPAPYFSLLKTAAQLTCLLKKSFPSGEIKIHIDDTFNMGSISTEFEILTIDDTAVFAEIVRAADNMEIYPLTNGKSMLDITFQSVLKTLS